MHFQLGALDINNNNFCLPFSASKQNNYKCIECNEKVKFCKGDYNKPYFSHYPNGNCNYYEHPSESDIHKNAKFLLANLLENRIKIIFTRKTDCNHDYKLENKIIYNKYDEIEVEFKKENFIADIAILSDNKIKYIFEIFVTHKTELERPEPWFEIDAKKLIEKCNSNFDSLEIECIRSNITKLCYGPFCLEEKCLYKIPYYNNNDNCIICNKIIIEAIVLLNKKRKICTKCYIADIPHNNRKIRNYLNNIIPQEIVCNIIPILKKNNYKEGWFQDLSCFKCKRYNYVPIWNKQYYALCKYCFNDKKIQKILGFSEIPKYKESNNII
jgi:hypothetical protein